MQSPSLNKGRNRAERIMGVVARVISSGRNFHVWRLVSARLAWIVDHGCAY